MCSPSLVQYESESMPEGLEFAAYPRKQVRLPSGRIVLVAVRRNLHRRWPLWDYFGVRESRWLAERVRRWLSSDHSYIVDLYERPDGDFLDDAGEMPRAEPARSWTFKDKESACIFAKRLASTLGFSGETPDL